MTSVDPVATSPALPYFERYCHITIAYSRLADHGMVLDHCHVPGRGVVGYAQYKNLMIMNADPLCITKEP